MSRPPTSPFDSREVRTLQTRLLEWFEGAARDLPWRRTGDPYGIWVSEVMLQQTRVETAVGYYRRWMDRFPTVHALAGADREAVLESWAGLGYYSRARNLHRAAQWVRDRMGGEVPRTAAALRELPGVGPYTSGAIASIAFGEAEPAVDGNVRRVLSRLRDVATPTPSQLDGLARSLIPLDDPGDFNQALMELGATICTPKSPQCSACPLSELCLARRRGTVADRPAKKASRPPKPVRINVAVVVRHTSPPEILLTRNPDEGLLGGMWGLPESDPTPDGVHTIPLPTVRHRFSHLDAMYVARLIDADHIPFLAEPELRPQSADPPARRWIREDELMSAAVPVAQRKIVMSAFEVLRAD